MNSDLKALFILCVALRINLCESTLLLFRLFCVKGDLFFERQQNKQQSFTKVQLQVKHRGSLFRAVRTLEDMCLST